MRIALVITELDPGGAEKCLVQLAGYLKRCGHVVKIFALGARPSPERNLLLEQVIACEIEVEFAGAASVKALPYTMHWLSQQLRTFRADIIQAMLFHGNLLAALSTDFGKTILVGGVRVRQPEVWRWWLQRWAAKRMAKVVCVSDDVMRHCADKEGIPPAKLLVIPNGVDLAEIDLQLAKAKNLCWTQLGLPKSARVLLFVGRMHPQKGIEQLLDHADRMLEALPEHHFVMMGEGPLRLKLATTAKRLVAANRIHFVGWQANPIPWMGHAELLLLPAIYEGMPNVVLEAMAARCPVVSFDIDGVRQVLGDAEDASFQIARPADFVHFVELVKRLSSNLDARKKCGSCNRARVEQHFELSKQLELYERLYLGLLGHPKIEPVEFNRG
jgi:glycosyltransferase involved in cell wall biosynthesis